MRYWRSLIGQVQADPNRIVVSGQNLASTAVGKPSYFTIANVTGSVEDVEINVEGETTWYTFVLSLSLSVSLILSLIMSPFGSLFRTWRKE